MKKLFFLTALLCASVMGWATQYCDVPTGHENNPEFGDANGRILLSIEPTANENEYKLTIKPNYASGATKKLDYLYVIAGGNSPYPATSGTDDDGNAYDEMSVTFTNSNATTSFTIQWSHPDWGGRWQCTPEDVPLSELEACGAIDPTDYTITVDDDIEGGSIGANASTAKAGATITLTATPDSGKKLSAWIVKDSEDADVTVTNNKFTMPHSNVTITATFIDKPVLTPATYWGEDEIVREEVHYPVLWSITRNEDATLTFAVEITGDVLGIVPQINIGGPYHDLSKGEGNSWSYSDATEYEDGNTVTGFFFLAYNSGSKRIDWDGYTVGASNKKPGPATAVENVEVGAKAIKMFENGQLVIIKNGVKYNALGAELR